MTPNHMTDATTPRFYRCTKLDTICVVVLILYFLHFAVPARHGGFREDEMMNLWTYWYVGPVQSVFALAKFWTPSYRPGGALYYLPLYHLFGLNPLPYRIAQVSILALSIPIAYYLARLLSASRSVAFLAILAFCYHPYVANLVFVGAFIYDVLCGLFYFAAFSYYVHIREKGIYLGPFQLVLFLLLYVCALNSKEMAVTLPFVLLLYELLKTPHWCNWSSSLTWIRRAALPSLITGVMTAIYTYSKICGSGSVTRFDSYRPTYSWNTFVTSNAKFVGDLFYVPEAITPTTLLLIWAAVFIYAFLRRDRMLRLMAFWVVIIPLPIAFLSPIRSGGCLYLLLYGWAMIFARAVCDLIACLANWKGVVWRTRVALVSLSAIALAAFTDWQNHRLATVSQLLAVGQNVKHVIAAFDSLDLQPAPRSTVLLKPDEQIFQNKWHPLFIASLVWNDHSLQIAIDKLNKLTPQQLAAVDYIISLTEFEATVIRSPNGQKTM